MFSVEQIRHFLAVVDEGSFSAAAKVRHCAQPAISYAVRKMEDMVGVALFDRSAYRPRLTTAGQSLLPQLRRVADDVRLLDEAAKAVSSGSPQQLSIVVDPVCPMPLLIGALKAFQQHYPAVRTQLYTDVLDAVPEYLVEGKCSIGILSIYTNMPSILDRVRLTEIGLQVVVAPQHSLADMVRPISLSVLREHVQLVLMDKAGFAGVRDFALLSDRVWRLGGLAAMQSMLRAGLGFAIMPTHLVHEDIGLGQLVALDFEGWREIGAIPSDIYAAWLADKPLDSVAMEFLGHLRQHAAEM